MTKQNKKVEQKLILGIDPDIFNNWPVKEKLIFWDEKNLNWLHSKYPSEPMNIVSEKSEKALIIFTKIESDNRIINKWRLEHYRKDNHEENFDSIIRNYEGVLLNNPQAKVYIKRQLSYTVDRKEKAYSYELDECPFEYLYYRLGGNSA